MIRKTILSIIVGVIMTFPCYASTFYISIAPSEIEFNISNSSGLVTGYTPNGVLGQIPSLPYYRYATEVGRSEAELKLYEKYHISSVSGPSAYIVPDIYKLTLYGSSIPIIAKMEIGLLWRTNMTDYAEYKGDKLIYPNSVWVYEFDVPANPPANNQIVLIKVAQSVDLLKDLTTAGQLGYIGNAKFVSELTKEINEIEAERSKVDPSHGSGDGGLTPAQKAKKEYTELLKEITEKYNKPEGDEFVKKEAYDVLREDIEYIINHIQ